ncbi:MAG: MmgE/PrpD family protein [Betaproteobacteria bacterium]|nr:MmgE/PrpD family protein [Betaproteobacteria bacterium]
MIYHHQLGELIDLADAFRTPLSCWTMWGGVIGVGEPRSKRAAVLARWTQDRANWPRGISVYVKLGGMGMPVFGFDLRNAKCPPGRPSWSSLAAPDRRLHDAPGTRGAACSKAISGRPAVLRHIEPGTRSSSLPGAVAGGAQRSVLPTACRICLPAGAATDRRSRDSGLTRTMNDDKSQREFRSDFGDRRAAPHARSRASLPLSPRMRALRCLPEEVRAEAARAFLNWMGCVGGCRDPAVAIGGHCRRRGGGNPQASIIGHGRRTHIASAAFLNCLSSTVNSRSTTPIWQP